MPDLDNDPTSLIRLATASIPFLGKLIQKKAPQPVAPDQPVTIKATNVTINHYWQR